MMDGGFTKPLGVASMILKLEVTTISIQFVTSCL
jgi:hypothetical protein